MVDHDAEIAPRFLENEVICMFGVPKSYILKQTWCLSVCLSVRLW
jgi:hypothetical protein